MFVKWVLFSILIGFAAGVSYRRSSDACTAPSIENGKIRLRLKSKLVRFSCLRRYTLVGNTYATCINGEWDVPLPVCVRPGCTLPSFDNGLRLTSYDDAWVMLFCNSGYSLVGSRVIYCKNGREWNTTVTPTCVETKATPPLSCDFEQENLCGWSQDERHDFDWLRWNEKTPSSFLFTGPSYDHTFGRYGSGYFMYIESTSRLQNDTARLLSPIYDRSIAQNGCFSFYYHMYGKDTGGLRVYQKPDSLDLHTLVAHLPASEKQKYILFEKWGNLGNAWYGDVSNLTDFSEDFQIVVEGIRGVSVTSDIAIDDVAILHGENCTVTKTPAVGPSLVMPDSCSGRCKETDNPIPGMECSCAFTCIDYGICCQDFFEVCVLNAESCTGRCLQINNNPSAGCSCFPTCLDEATCCHDFFEVCVLYDLGMDYGLPIFNDTVPQTQKLVATSPQTTITTTTTTERPTTTTTTTTTERSTTLSTTTTERSTTTSTTPRPTTTTRKPTTSTTKRTTTQKLTTPTVATIKRPNVSTSSTTPKYTTRKSTPKPSTRKVLSTIKNTTPKVTTPKKITVKPTIKPSTTVPHGISRTIENHNMYHDLVEKAKKEMYVENRKIGAEESKGKKQTSGWKIAFIIIGVTFCSICVVWVAKVARSQRGRTAIARLRGRLNHDSEVRYLSEDVDDDC